MCSGAICYVWLMRTLLLTLGAAIIGSLAHAQATLKPEQIKLMEGAWQGELVVHNPKTMQERSLASEMIFAGVGERRWRIGFGNATAPAAKKMDSWTLSDDGSTCDEKTVVEVKQFGADSLRFVLEVDGKESITPARIRMVYTVGKNHCNVRKEIAALNEAGAVAGDFALRQEYRLKR